MPFVKGDPKINRKGRPKNAESQSLRDALERKAKATSRPFWDVVADAAYEDSKVMIAVLKKFIPDMTSNDITAEMTHQFNRLPRVLLDGKEQVLDIGKEPEDECSEQNS